jgi:hypothetical protein
MGSILPPGRRRRPETRSAQRKITLSVLKATAGYHSVVEDEAAAGRRVRARAVAVAAAVALLVVLGIVLGSRGLRDFDSALIPYTVATVVLAFGVTYRYLMWVSEPVPTRSAVRPRAGRRGVRVRADARMRGEATAAPTTTPAAATAAETG